MSRVLFLIIALLLGLNGFQFYRDYQRQIVVAVPDGDSIQLYDGRRVRLLGIDAPERNRCGAEEARIRLTELVNGRHVTLSNLVTDDYGRQLANVFTRGIFVNEVILREGLAKYTSAGKEHAKSMKTAAQTATEQKKGIHSETCRPPTSPDGCAIKGNQKNGDKTYHLPGCKNYNQTSIDLSYGDAWFCNEEEAIEAGFERAGGCE